MGNLKIEYLKISDLIPYANNPRINDDAVAGVVESKALLGNADEIQVLQVSGLTDEQKRKYRLLDNKVGEVATWDFDKLELELEGLDFDDYDFGFDTV